MISDILAIKPYDRWFVFLSTFYMLGIMYINMRAFFKKVYGHIPNNTNDRIFYTGIAACIALPMIGIFDEHDYRPLHYVFAGIFFGGFSLYGIWLGHVMFANKDKFPESEHRTITTLQNNTMGLFLVTGALIFSTFWFGTTCRITPAFEWATGFYVVNYYAIMAYANPYYDSIHPEFEVDKEKQANKV